MRGAFAEEIDRILGLRNVELIEKDLLISELDEEDFYDFVGKFQGFLKRIGAKISI